MNKESIKKFSIAWLINFIDVYLFAAAINSLFQWLSRGNTYDMSLFIFSLIGGIYVYFTSISQKSKKTKKFKLQAAVISIIVWLIATPIILNLSGFKP